MRRAVLAAVVAALAACGGADPEPGQSYVFQGCLPVRGIGAVPGTAFPAYFCDLGFSDTYRPAPRFVTVEECIAMTGLPSPAPAAWRASGPVTGPEGCASIIVTYPYVLASLRLCASGAPIPFCYPGGIIPSDAGTRD